MERREEEVPVRGVVTPAEGDDATGELTLLIGRGT